MSNLIYCAVILIGSVAVDDSFGSIFPDIAYCLVGAGTEYRYPSSTMAVSWSDSGACAGSTNPQCATQWETRPAVTLCAHSTLWRAWREKLGFDDKVSATPKT